MILRPSINGKCKNLGRNNSTIEIIGFFLVGYFLFTRISIK